MRWTSEKAGKAGLARVVLSPGAVLTGHEHDTLHLTVTLSGSWWERGEKGWERHASGGARLSVAGVAHDQRYEASGADLLILHLPGKAMAKERRAFADLRRVPRLGEHPAVLRARQLIGTRNPDRLELEALAWEVMATAVHGNPAHRKLRLAPDWLRRIRDRLHAQGPMPSLAELAAVGPCHPTHLSRAFPTYFGLTLSEYARLCRLDRARRAIVESDRSFGRIAHQLGFADQSHLTRAVRSRFGRTPSDLRRGDMTQRDR